MSSPLTQCLPFTELTARDRVRSILDPGTFRELLGPADRVESPHLPIQGIVPQTDDGAVIGRGTIDGVSAVVAALDGRFQGGGVGEISGAKLAAALERAAVDLARGIDIRVVLVLDTGGIRLQEANLGLLAIAEIHAALVELRRGGPVVGVIGGPLGCFGGMGIAAGLTSHLIMTRNARLGLNGPEVIESEAGVDELNARNRPLIWSTIGGTQRTSTRFAEMLVDDEADRVGDAVRAVWTTPSNPGPARADQIDRGLRIVAAVDPVERPDPARFRTLVEEIDR
ncbi:biotin-independent malonate decarboxylase subunit beta [Gordonia sp. NPDC003424]